MPKNRNFRKRQVSDSEVEEREKSCDETHEVEAIQLAKKVKEMRKRSRGLVGDVTKESSVANQIQRDVEGNSDDFRGGLVDLKSNFLAESQKGDVDRQMLVFIENELKKRRGETVELSPTKQNPDGELYKIPENLNVKSKIKGDDMMSQQMLEGIPEVDLGIANKIKNIEATESAKQKLIEEARNKNTNDSTYNVKGFVPNNVTVNFVQHNRWDGEGVFKSLVPHAPTNLKKASKSEMTNADKELAMKDAN